METYLFKWRITEKHVETEYQGFSDVIYKVGYECSGTLIVVDPTTEIEQYFTEDITGIMDISFVPSGNFVPLTQVDDDAIFSWLTSLGLNKSEIEQQIRDNLSARL